MSHSREPLSCLWPKKWRINYLVKYQIKSGSSHTAVLDVNNSGRFCCNLMTRKIRRISFIISLLWAKRREKLKFFQANRFFFSCLISLFIYCKCDWDQTKTSLVFNHHFKVFKGFSPHSNTGTFVSLLELFFFFWTVTSVSFSTGRWKTNWTRLELLLFFRKAQTATAFAAFTQENCLETAGVFGRWFGENVGA